MLTLQQQDEVDKLVYECNERGDGYNDIAMEVSLLIASFKIPKDEK